MTREQQHPIFCTLSPALVPGHQRLSPLLLLLAFVHSFFALASRARPLISSLDLHLDLASLSHSLFSSPLPLLQRRVPRHQRSAPGTQLRPAPSAQHPSPSTGLRPISSVQSQRPISSVQSQRPVISAQSLRPVNQRLVNQRPVTQRPVSAQSQRPVASAQSSAPTANAQRPDPEAQHLATSELLAAPSRQCPVASTQRPAPSAQSSATHRAKRPAPSAHAAPKSPAQHLATNEASSLARQNPDLSCYTLRGQIEYKFPSKRGVIVLK
jgi:hypothetical protein